MVYGAVVILLILWYALVWSPMGSKIDEVGASMETARLRLERLEKNYRRLKGVDARLQQARKNLQAARATLLRGDRPEMVAVTLQDMVLKKASQQDLNVVTYKVGKARKFGDYQVVSTSFTINTDTAKLAAFLKALEDERKAFRISSMNIVKVLGRNPMLRVNMELQALVMTKESK